MDQGFFAGRSELGLALSGAPDTTAIYDLFAELAYSHLYRKKIDRIERRVSSAVAAFTSHSKPNLLFATIDLHDGPSPRQTIRLRFEIPSLYDLQTSYEWRKEDIFSTLTVRNVEMTIESLEF